MTNALGPLTIRDRYALFARDLAVDLGNFHLLHYRHIDGFLITAKNSGTHWLKYMISHALAAELGLPPPRFASGREANAFVGHPKWPHRHPQAPRIGSSHNLPSSLLRPRPVFRALRPPPIVVLVRDIEQAMLSHYVKWREEHGLGLADYVYAPAPGRRTVADVWWYVSFFNRWGRFAEKYPKDILVLRYEQVRADPRYWLTKVLAHYRVPVSQPSIDAAVAATSREAMRKELDPNAGELIIPADQDRDQAAFSQREQADLHTILARRLRYDFGYHYQADDLPAAHLGVA